MGITKVELASVADRASDSLVSEPSVIPVVCVINECSWEECGSGGIQIGMPEWVICFFFLFSIKDRPQLNFMGINSHISIMIEPPQILATQ